MKVLFLDFDGVINSHNGYAKRNYDKKEIENPYPLFEEHIEPLNWLIDEVKDLKIVISSTWRKHLELKKITEMMVEKGFKYPEVIIGKTPLNGPSRIDEINAWMEDVDDIEKFVVVDDKPMKDFGEAFIQVYSSYGFMHFDAVLCKAYLTGEKAPMLLF